MSSRQHFLPQHWLPLGVRAPYWISPLAAPMLLVCCDIPPFLPMLHFSLRLKKSPGPACSNNTSCPSLWEATPDILGFLLLSIWSVQLWPAECWIWELPIAHESLFHKEAASSAPLKNLPHPHYGRGCPGTASCLQVPHVWSKWTQFFVYANYLRITISW